MLIELMTHRCIWCIWICWNYMKDFLICEMKSMSNFHIALLALMISKLTSWRRLFGFHTNLNISGENIKSKRKFKSHFALVLILLNVIFSAAAAAVHSLSRFSFRSKQWKFQAPFNTVFIFFDGKNISKAFTDRKTAFYGTKLISYEFNFI